MDLPRCPVPRSLPDHVFSVRPVQNFPPEYPLIAVRNQVGQYDWLLKQIGKSAAWAGPKLQKNTRNEMKIKNTHPKKHAMKINKNPQHQKIEVMPGNLPKKHTRKFIPIYRKFIPIYIGGNLNQKFPFENSISPQITRPTALAFSVDTDHIYTATEYLGDRWVCGWRRFAPAR